MSEPQKRFPVGKIRDIKGHGPYVMVVKQDGRVQPFNRDTMIASIRGAGATLEEANIVTNRVSNRLLDRNVVPSNEMSSMVARSLSHMNSTASRNYVDNRERKLAYTQRVYLLSAEIATINQHVNDVTNSLENLMIESRACNRGLPKFDRATIVF
ncbi:ATP cone domain-containing protein [Candidatus Bathyarchaeota archaeon]|nr:ATP cone domain-containing protein [Candidatus Bathyarchaeota archaeon]